MWRRDAPRKQYRSILVRGRKGTCAQFFLIDVRNSSHDPPDFTGFIKNFGGCIGLVILAVPHVSHCPHSQVYHLTHVPFIQGTRLIIIQEQYSMKRMSVLTMAIAMVMVLCPMTGCAMGAPVTKGSLSDMTSLSWTISSGVIDGVLVPGERQATTTYGDYTQAVGGTSRYAKSFSLDTRGMYQGQYNVDSQKVFTYDGNPDGRAVSGENIGIETMGLPGTNDTWPAYHNTINAGSSFDIFQGSVYSQAQARTVAAYPGAASVALNYRFSLFGA